MFILKYYSCNILHGGAALSLDLITVVKICIMSPVLAICKQQILLIAASLFESNFVGNPEDRFSCNKLQNKMIF